MSNNNGEDLDELYLKYFPLNSPPKSGFHLCLFMVSNDLHSAKFKGIFSALIFLDLSDVWGTAFHTCPFEGFWLQFLRHFYCLLLFLITTQISSLISHIYKCLSFFFIPFQSLFSQQIFAEILYHLCLPAFFLFYTDSFVFTVIEENNFQIPSNTTLFLSV